MRPERMNTTIWKYDLKPSCEIELPIGAKVLSVGNQYNEAKMWVQVNPNETKKELRKFKLVGTGMRGELDGTEQFIGSIFCYSGSLVLHAFEVIPQEAPTNVGQLH